MGVLSIALPVTHRRTAGRTNRAVSPLSTRRSARSTANNPAIVPAIYDGSRGKLVQPSEPAEAMVERTPGHDPAQEAAQEAIARLVRQCIAGDAQAWQQLVVSQHRRIYAICYRFTGSSSDAEDLTQDVFLKLYKNLATFDLQKGSFQTWITTLARNLLVDHFRRSRLDRASDSLDATYDGEEDGPTMADRLADSRSSQEQQFASLELKNRIQDALKQLSPELREAVILRDLEDMDYKEIAQVLRIPEGTVKSRISRGRGELAKLLQRIEKQQMM
ncbi:MAG TPA: sigma-70 family RNA polymerase sigma factor [Edaphobacter sp.]